MKYLLILLALLAPSAALAQGDVALASEVFVERVVTDAQGKQSVVREEPKVVTPGDRIVVVISYQNKGAAPKTGFELTNPIPDAISFSEADGGALVSADGGKSWGALASLKVKQPDGTVRAAAPADVTHVRWSFAQPIAPGNKGQKSFRGIVK